MKKKEKEKENNNNNIDTPFIQIKNFFFSFLSTEKIEKGDFPLNNFELLQVQVVPSTTLEIESDTQKYPISLKP
jgi:hypothetical protein